MIGGSSASSSMPLYRRAPVVRSFGRRSLVFAAKLFLAALYGVAVVMLPPSVVWLLAVPIVVCLGVVLWMLPDGGTFPLGAIQRTYSVWLVLLILWPSYIAVVLPGLPWLTPTRFTLFILTFFFLYSVSISGVLRRRLMVVARASKGVWICFLLWQLTQFISMPFSKYLSLTLTKIVDNQLSLNSIFFLGCLLFSIRGNATRTVGWLIALAVICSLDGFLELKLGYPPWANHIPSFMRVDDAAMSSALGSQARAYDGVYRVRGPFSLSLVYAEYLALCMPFILHWMVTGRSMLLRAAMAVAWLLVFVAIIISQSRLGQVGALIAHVIYLLVWAYRRWKSDDSSLLGAFMLFGAPIAALMLVGVILSSHTLSNSVFGNGSSADSDEARRIQRQMAIPKVISNPIGHGLSTSGETLGFRSPSGFLTVDNHYITTALDLGVLGLFSFYGMFLIAAWTGIKLFITTADRENELAGPLGMMLLVFFVIKSVLSQENNHTLVLLLLGMMMALCARERALVDPDGAVTERHERL